MNAATSDDAPSPQQKAMEAAKCILRAGIWLIRNGYGRLMLLPYAAPSGMHWRCEFHPPGQRGKSLYHYSTSSGTHFLSDHGGGEMPANPSPQRLAQAIMETVPPDAKAACKGDASPEMLQWLQDLEEALAAGFIAEAFREYTSDFSKWQLISMTRGESDPIRPQPGYIPPHIGRSDRSRAE